MSTRSIEKALGGLPPARKPVTPLPLVLVLSAWSAIVAFACYRYQPVSPVPPDQASGFSAMNAAPYLEALAGEAIPRPAGSEQNLKTAEQITDWMTGFGYRVIPQPGFRTVRPAVRVRSPTGSDVQLTNLLALPGPESDGTAETDSETFENDAGRTVLVVAHYDSVPFGPGASDNGGGVAAAIEIARMLSRQPLRCEVGFLFTDGEELGLLGARLFERENPYFSRVGFVINLDARGTSGPSLMFETSGSSGDLIPIFSRASPQPRCSSLFYEIYRYLPNDTDFTVFREAEIPGFNFAYIGNVDHYHTAGDNLANFNWGSLQHHGGNVWGLLRELDQLTDDAGNLPLVSQAPSLVYSDWCGLWIYRWPASAGLGIAVLLTVLWLGFAVKSIRMYGWKNLAISAAALALAFVLILALGTAVAWLAGLDNRLATPWPRRPLFLILAVWLAALAVTCGLVALSEKRLRLDTTSVALVGFAVALAVLTSFLLPGASHLFLIPATAGALGLLLVDVSGLWRKRTPVTGQAPLLDGSGPTRWRWVLLALLPIAMGLVWLPVEPLIYDAMGFRFKPLLPLRTATVVATLVPCLIACPGRVRFGAAIASTLLAVGSLGIALMLNNLPT